MKKLSKAILLSLVAILVASMPVLAAVSYRAAYTIVESNGTAYDMLPTSVLVDNQWLADNGFLQDDALDTRIETLGGSVKPHMVATNKTLTAIPVPANSQTNLYFTTANSDLNSLDIITGYDGYITITDDDTLELGSDFEIEQKGYVDTDADSDKNLVYKEDAFRTYISGATNITSEITSAPSTYASQTTDGYLHKWDPVYNTAWTAVNAVDVFTANEAWIGQGTANPKIYRAFFYFDTSALPEDAVIIAATLRLYGFNDSSTTDFDITIQTGSGGHPADPLVLGDYSKAFYSGDGGSLTTLGFNAAGYNSIPLNATGMSWISLTGVTKLAVRSSRDIAGTAPGGNEFVKVYTNDEAGVDKDPELVITYTRSITATSISSDEYTVKTYGVANEPQWATGDVLHFDGDNDVVTVADDASIANPFDGGGSIDVWLNPDSDGGAAAGRAINKNKWQVIVFGEAAGKIKIRWSVDFTGVNGQWDTDDTQLTIGEWNHFVITYDADAVANDPIFYVNNAVLTVGAGITEVSTPTLVRADDVGDLYIGNTGGFNRGWEGLICDMRMYDTIVNAATVADRYAGDYSDRTNLIAEWYLDEGTGTSIPDYSVNTNTGTLAGAVWQTETYTTGSTGRLCDFYIEVDDGVLDPDRWGANLKGASVPTNANDWKLNQNNVMPYMDYYKHTVGGVLHAWYQPNDIVVNTDYDGTETAGGSAVTVTDNTMTDAPGYWVDALVTITEAGGVAPEGETSICTVFAAGGVITVAPAFSANVDIGDDFTIEFGTLIDRSYYGLSFDGANDYVDISGIGTSDLSAAATFECWVQPLADDDMLFSIYSGAGLTDQRFMIYEWSNKWTVVIATGAASQRNASSLTPDKTQKVHLVVTYDGARLKMYADASNILDVAQTITPATLGIPSRIGEGTFGAAYHWNGYMDSVRIYNRAFGQTEITYNYNGGVGNYTPYSTSGLVGQWHMEEGSGTGAILTDSSGEGNTGTISGATWVNGFVPRPVGNAGTNDSRVTWGANPTGVAVTLGGMVSEGQPTPGALPSDPAQDILPETEVTDWYIEPDVTGTLLTNPLRPFVTMWSDNSTLTELQCWRIYALALILLITVATAMAVGHHQGITMIMAGVAILGAVVLTIFPMWALVFAIGMFIGGLVMERSPSL